MHINKVNGKKYIGITCRPVEQRWHRGNGYYRLLFGKAIRKYGWDGFEHLIIAVGLLEADAKEMEIRLIREHETNKRGVGYNITEGGQGTRGCRPCLGRKATDAERLAQSIRNRGRKLSVEARKKIGDSQRGRYGWWNGKKHSPETISKLKETIKGRYVGAENPRAMAVINTKTLEVYGCIKEAAVAAGRAYGHFKLIMAKKVPNYTDYMFLSDYEEVNKCQELSV